MGVGNLVNELSQISVSGMIRSCGTLATSRKPEAGANSTAAFVIAPTSSCTARSFHLAGRSDKDGRARMSLGHTVTPKAWMQPAKVAS